MEDNKEEKKELDIKKKAEKRRNIGTILIVIGIILILIAFLVRAIPGMTKITIGV